MQKLSLLFFMVITLNGFSQKATITEYNQSIKTYPFSDPDPVPSFKLIYPYFRFDGFTDKAIQKDWKVVKLENDFIKLTILPEIGGKIWSAIEKSTGKPFIYENHVVKFRDIAMRGPWTSGGIEANYGIMGHTPNCATPVDYLTRKKEDGSVSCFIGVMDLLTQTHWTIEINLPKDKAYFTTKSFWYNPTGLEQPYYSWMNAGFKTTGNLQYIYPGNRYLGHEGEYNDWPVNAENGKDLSYYNNNNFGSYKSYHVFGRYTGFFGGYWHDEDYGVARYSDRDDKAGKKIWIWGLSDQGMIWKDLLTDSDGQYTEMQSGRLFNQTADKSTFTPFKHKGFFPQATDVWTEYWYPVLHTKGYVQANEYGALNVKAENGWVKMFFNPVQTIADTLVVLKDNIEVYRKLLSLRPLITFVDSLSGDLTESKWTFSLGKNKLVYQSDTSLYQLNRPVKPASDFDWESSYGQYLLGTELMHERKYGEAQTKLEASLKKDPWFLPSLVKMSELLYRNMQFDEGLNMAKKALQVNTNDGGANYFYGLCNSKTGNIFDAKDGFEIATLSSDYKSAAYFELSRLYLKEKNWRKAIEYSYKSTDFNRYNIMALQTRAIAFRKSNDLKEAKSTIDMIQTFDPLNHFTRFESYLINPSKTNLSVFTSSIQNELPRETYMQMAVDYFNNGCLHEAEKVLQFSSGPMGLYWTAYLHDLMGITYTEYLKKANKTTPAFTFPYRTEDEAILLWAAGQTADWKPSWYLALLYKHKNRETDAIRQLDKCGNKPDFAPFYAFRASLKNSSSPKEDFEKAISLDKNDWRYTKLYAEYLLEKGEEQKASVLLNAFYKTQPNNYIIGMLYARALLLNRNFKESSLVLSTLKILPFEGATSGHEYYRESLLMQAINAVKKTQFSQAKILIDSAKLWPLHLGAGKPYNTNIDDRPEEWLLYLTEVKKDPKQAEKHLENILDKRNPKLYANASVPQTNDLVTAWAIERLNSHARALEWINKRISLYPQSDILLWVKESFQKNNQSKSDRAESAKRLLISMMETGLDR